VTIPHPRILAKHDALTHDHMPTRFEPMLGGMKADRFTFPRWTNSIRPCVGGALVVIPAYVVLLLWYGASPRTTDVGYAPRQPIPYSHALHAGELGIDCRYCHTTVETAGFAAVPPTQTCMNCHKQIRGESPKLTVVRASLATGMPVEWIRVHDLPAYAYFNHSAHVLRGIGCVSCHGRVDTMAVVSQVERLSMGWCLECHRTPMPHLRPLGAVTRMDWAPPSDPSARDALLDQTLKISPPTDCSTCHR